MSELITYYQPVMWSERHKRYDCYSVFAYSSIEDARTKCRLWRSSGYICIILPYVPSRMFWNEKYNPPDPIPIDSDLPF